MAMDAARAGRIEGLMVGLAVGDAIGLPREGLSARRAGRIFGEGPLRHALFFGRGMCSDDTEHACMTLQAILASGGDVSRFRSSLAWRLRWWLIGLPAGVGLATAKSILRLWVGFPATRSGVRSAGNGPAMRAPVIGATVDDIATVAAFSEASARLTHTHEDAVAGSLAVALAAHSAVTGEVSPAEYRSLLRRHLTNDRVLQLILNAAARAEQGAELATLLADMGLTQRVSGYINHTVPVAVFCWLRWRDDYREAVSQVVRAGGDTDSTAAIVGALVGAGVGVNGVPQDWLGGVMEWPRSIAWIRSLAARGADRAAGPLGLNWIALPLRNLLFLAVVLLHGFRRLLPPY